MEQNKSQTYFFFALLSLALVVSFFIFRFYLAPLVLAIALASVFRPVYVRLLAIFRRKRGFAAVLTTLITLLVVLVPLVFFGIQVVKEASDLYTAVNAGHENLSLNGTFNTLLARYIPALSTISFDVSQYLQNGLNWLITNIGFILSSFMGVIVSFALSLIALYYLLKDGETLKRMLILWSPLSSKYDEEIFDRLEKTVNSVMKGNLIIAVIHGFLAGISFVIFGLPQPALWSLVAMIASLVPLVGTTMITIPAAIYLLFSGSIGHGVGLGVWAIVLAAVIDNLLRPKFIERGVPIHPFLILLSILGGVELFGPIGFVMGPLVLSFAATLLTLYPRVVGTRDSH